MEERDDVIIEHPNRAKASSKATKGAVLLLLLVSVALMLIVTVGGWDALQGAKPVTIGYILVYVIIAYYVAQWNRGVLPVAAALAILLAIFAAVAVPGWFDRDHNGFDQPAIDAGILGLVTALIIPVQVLLLAFAMRAFNQAWNVEVERTPPARGGSAPAAA
jgi:energy-coupling factor transporter transmembrane protein EcfT